MPAHSFIATLLTLLVICGSPQAKASLLLRYNRPAPEKEWEQAALPLGNGRLGCMLFGDPTRERLQFNVDSLWTGDTNPSGDYGSMGAYQAFGDLWLEQEHADFTAYQRTLDLASGLHTTTYQAYGIGYTRETFVSAPAQVIVTRLTANRSGAHTGKLRLTGAHQENTQPVADGLFFEGRFENQLAYAAQIKVLHRGGQVTVANDTVNFKECHEIIILLAAATDYLPNAACNWRGLPPRPLIEKQLQQAAQTKYPRLRRAHVDDVAGYMSRCDLKVGATAPAQRQLPTDERLKAYIAGTHDPELEVLLFQMGRYLLQASSRPGTLPANLQGIWNHSNTPPWHSDYHVNINVQMNYWGAEPANLADCHTPLFDLIQSQIPVWRQATAAAPEFKINGQPPTQGWAIRTSHNIMGGLGWKWDKTANAWYCHHLWEHYAFSDDLTYLRQVAWPIIRETTHFWAQQLKRLPDGRLVVPNAWSPEHGPEEDGVSYSQQIIWNLFNDFVAAARLVRLDLAYCAQVEKMRDQLVAPQIGKWGQLQEWMVDRDDPDTRHRHTSHLFAVYPGHQITMQHTPELVRAAAVSLEARGETGDSRRSWSWPWRCALWARMGNAEKSHHMLRSLLVYNTLPNLFTTHPPFQIDGNLGISGAICEMLVQSQDYVDEAPASYLTVLLPALPPAWPDGEFKGMRARGGLELDVTWQKGQLTHATVRAQHSGTYRLRYGAHETRVTLKAGRQTRLTPAHFTSTK